MAGQKLDPRVSIAPDYARTKRTMRRPQHTFQIRQRPFEIQPFMIAPVLPGETLKNLTLQDRVVSDPLKPSMKLIGWWCEHFFFYVKHRDLNEPERTMVTNMMLDPATDLSTLKSSTITNPFYQFEQGMKWLEFCMKPICEHYFRDEGEAWDSAVSTAGLPLAQVFGKGHNNWTDSLTLDAAKRNRDVALPTNIENFDDQFEHWMSLRDAGLVTMDYEDFIRTYGVKVRQEETSPEIHRPELIRYLRDWTYPTNIVEPTTGIPTTAAAWSIAERADKDRFFAEPGFIVGVSVQRPKVYMGNLRGYLAAGMDNVFTWLPAVLNEHYEKGFKKFTVGQGPVPLISTDYWVDIRDLFVHGDQFSNYNPNLADAPQALAIPLATGERRYPAAADLDEMFNAAAPANVIRHDGVVSLGILGRQADHTPQRAL